MAQGVRTAKTAGGGVAVHHVIGLLDLIEQNRKVVLWSPFILAAALILLYAFAGNEFRQVVDFLSPARILGH